MSISNGYPPRQRELAALILRTDPDRPRPPAIEVVIGLLCAAAATGLCLLVAPYVDPQVPWTVSLLAVLISSALAGARGALAALAVSAIARAYLFFPPEPGSG